MKRLSWLVLFNAIAIGALLAQAAESAAIDVPFKARIAAADLKIERVKAELSGENIRFTVYYASERERHLSIFDPPRGATVKHVEEGALKAAGADATFLVPAEPLRRAPALTISFTNGESADTNFVFLSLTDETVWPVFGPRIPINKDGRTTPRVAPSTRRGGTLQEVPEFADIRWKDVSGVAGLTAEKIAGLTFNEATRWAPDAGEIARAIMRRGIEPGLGVKELHRRGIVGTGVSVGIIDQNMFPDHPEFKERVARYHDVGCNATTGSMHGPAVASLLVGKTIGTAPGARLFFVAAPSWTKDAIYYADALHWLLDLNATLPAREKIRVVSVSAAPSGDGSPFTKDNALWDAACEDAAKAGVLVLDCTAHRGVIGAGAYDPAAPDDVSRIRSANRRPNPALRNKRILTPMMGRTVAQEYVKGEYGFQYGGVGGLSWAIPYAAGVMALGWQANPALSGERMVELLRRTAYEKEGLKYIHPVAFVDAVKATLQPSAD